MEILYPRCCCLDVHKETVVACLRLVIDGKVVKEVRTFSTTTVGLMALSEWLAENKCTQIAMEATGVYWKPVWHILSDGEFELVLANAAHVKNVPGRKTDVKDADWVSDLLAHGLIRASFVPDNPTRRRCAGLLRTRKQLVREQVEPRPADTKDARGRQHQARFGDLGRVGRQRAGDDRGADRRRDRPGASVGAADHRVKRRTGDIT